MPAKYDVTFLDNSGEKSVAGVYIPDITEGNILTVLDGLDGFPDALKLAITGVSLCNDVKHQVHLQPKRLVEELPTDSYAQREMALLITMQDETNMKKSTMSIPGVNWDLLGTLGSDQVNPLAPVWVALKLALETYAVSPDGNGITVIGGRRVGRRN